MSQSRPFIRQPNEKWSMRAWICDHFPKGYEDMTYCEPYGGCANVLFHKKPSKIEVYNDIDESLVNLFRALRDEPVELSKRLSKISDSAESFNKSLRRKSCDDYMETAVHDFVLRKISKSNQKAVYQKLKSGDTWKSHVVMIPEFSKRIKNTFLYNKKAVEVIHTMNCDTVLLYCDPPYLHDSKGSKSLYDSDMSLDEHMDLYHLLNSFSGKVVLSGCMSPLYKRLYKNWNLHRKKLNRPSGFAEILWTNF